MDILIMQNTEAQVYEYELWVVEARISSESFWNRFGIKAAGSRF